MPAKPIPDGYHSVTPYITVQDGAKAIEFYKKAFGATEVMRMPGPGGKVMHAELRVGDSVIMLSDEFPEMGARSPRTIGGSGSFLMIYVPNVDVVFQQAVGAGAKVLKPLENQFYGDRSGTVEDASGHRWTIATHVEDVPPDEMKRRADAFLKKNPPP